MRNRILAVAVAVAAISGTSAAALAATGTTQRASVASASKTFTACVTQSHGVATLYAGVRACKPGQVRYSWNEAGPQGPAGPAGTSAVTSITATTSIVNWPESSGWAHDAMNRVLTETVQHAASSAKCGGTPVCYFVTGQISDNGTFQTVSGAASPNGSSSAKISGVLDGTMHGTADFEFYASSNVISASKVPASANGNAKPASTTNWGELAFPAGTTFVGVTLTAYDWDYNAPTTCENWNDQINPGDDGQGAPDGNIAGVNNCKV